MADSPILFQETPRIKQAIALINELDNSKFPLLLTRIVQKLHLKNERTFTTDEEEKLQKTLMLSAADLHLVVETLEFLFLQAAYYMAKPAIVSQQLQALNMSPDKVQVIIDTWTENAKDIVSHLRQQTVCPKQLESTNWRLNVQMAQANSSKITLQNALFEFLISDEQSSEKEKIQVEFTHSELYDFYNKLETVQRQLDSLT